MYSPTRNSKPNENQPKPEIFSELEKGCQRVFGHAVVEKRTNLGKGLHKVKQTVHSSIYMHSIPIMLHQFFTSTCLRLHFEFMYDTCPNIFYFVSLCKHGRITLGRL